MVALRRVISGRREGPCYDSGLRAHAGRVRRREVVHFSERGAAAQSLTAVQLVHRVPLDTGKVCRYRSKDSVIVGASSQSLVT